MSKKVALVALAGTLAGCQTARHSVVRGTTYGRSPDGQAIHVFTLVNANGVKACVSEFGASLHSLEVPDRKGVMADVTLGYGTPEGWLDNTSYLGVTVGRYANRIAHGKFTLDGKDYLLATNNEPGGIPCHLHGGRLGFDRKVWHGVPLRMAGARGVVFGYVSPDGEEGYPGELKTTVTYLLTDENELKILFEAVTDKPTIVNLSHHSYWNLGGNPTNTILDHELMLNAGSFLPTNPGLIPTGELTPVKDTPMDFSQPTRIGAGIDADYEPLRVGGGYDHCWCINGAAGEIRPAADLYDPVSGRGMQVFTDQPGIQFYSGNFLDGTVDGKKGVRYPRRSGLCLETQKYPDSPNQAAFPSSELRPGEVYRHTVIYRFYAK